MPNIIELNLLNNKSIVATMQGHPLANENSYKIIAGEENATKFIIKSIPNQYANARLTVEMVNSQGLGIAERELSEIEVDLVSYKGFILPVGMAVAGYGYVSIKAYLDNSTTTIENGTVSVDYTKLAPYTAYTFIYNGSAWELNKNVVDLSSYGITISGTPKENDVIQVREKVVFQPLKLKVWNTLPNWEDGISNESSLKIENGHLYSNVNGVWIDIGNVGGEVDKVLSLESENAIQNKAVTIALSEKVNAEDYNNDIDDIRNDVKNLYAITAQGGLYTMLEVEQAFSSRETADGENIVDGQYTAPTKIQGDTVACKNLFDISKVTNTSSLTNNGEALTVTAASPTSETLKELCPTLKAGDVLVMSFNTTSDANFIMFTSLNRSWTNGQSITIDENMLNDTLTFYHNVSSGASAVISNIQIEYGTTATDYQPYFTGLKSASFAGIESTNADGTETSTLAFPKTATPLGTTIDFENKKITNYGVDLVLTGTEKWAKRGISSETVMQFYSLLLDGVYSFADGVCTDFPKMVALTYTVGFAVGSSNKAVYLSVPKTQITSVEELKVWLAQRYADGNPVTIRYVSSTLQSESTFTEGNEYIAYKGGTEKVLENDGKEYGAMPTVTTEYFKLTEV